MNSFIKLVGTIFTTIIILGLPLLLCLSFTLGWHNFIKFFLIILTIIDMFAVGSGVWELSESV